MLKSCIFQHVRQDGNRLAHSSAKKTILFADLEVWVEDFPEDMDVVF